MNEKERLKRLLAHWLEHNNEHAETYREWARKMSAEGEYELSELLMRLGEETLRMRATIEEAIIKTGKH